MSTQKIYNSPQNPPMGGTYNAIRGIPLKRPHLTHVWDLCKFILCFSNGRELAWKTEKKEAKQEVKKTSKTLVSGGDHLITK